MCVISFLQSTRMISLYLCLCVVVSDCVCLSYNLKIFGVMNICWYVEKMIEWEKNYSIYIFLSMSRQAMIPNYKWSMSNTEKKKWNEKTLLSLTNIHFDNADMCTLTTATTIITITPTTTAPTNQKKKENWPNLRMMMHGNPVCIRSGENLIYFMCVCPKLVKKDFRCSPFLFIYSMYAQIVVYIFMTWHH